MKLDSMIYPWPERPRTDVNMVIVDCKCPKCKKILWKYIRNGYINKEYRKKDYALSAR